MVSVFGLSPVHAQTTPAMPPGLAAGHDGAPDEHRRRGGHRARAEPRPAGAAHQPAAARSGHCRVQGELHAQLHGQRQPRGPDAAAVEPAVGQHQPADQRPLDVRLRHQPADAVDSGGSYQVLFSNGRTTTNNIFSSSIRSSRRTSAPPTLSRCCATSRSTARGSSCWSARRTATSPTRSCSSRSPTPCATCATRSTT